MSVGGNRSNQSSSTSSEGLNQSYGSALNLGQEGYLQNLWGAGQNLANQNAGTGAGYAGYNAAQAGNQQGMNYLGAGANALGGTGQAMNTLGALQNPTVDPMLGVYAQQIGQNFNRNIMPAIQGQAALGGGLGGSRANIAAGVAAGDAQRNIQNFGAQLYGQGQDRALQAAGAQGQLAQGVAGMYGNLGQQAMQGGMNNLAIGQFGMGIPWYAQQQFAGLLGSPIMEDLGGYGETSANASSRGKSGGFSFGF